MGSDIRTQSNLLQELIVLRPYPRICVMEDDKEITEFARRLNELCDDMGVPPKGQARQATVGKLFDVSQKAARKWLEGEGFPTTLKAIKIATWANVGFEWLMTGRGSKKIAAPKSEAVNRVVDMMEAMSGEQQHLVARLVDQVIEPTNGSTSPTQPQARKHG